MLARLAENLFWAGRYIERAEDTARMVDVTYHTLLSSPEAEVVKAYRQLLDVLHLTAAYDKLQEADAHARDTPGNIVAFLVLDEQNPGSILSSIKHARENGRSVRELVSSELWEAMNDLHLTMRSRDLRSDLANQPYDLFRMVKQRCQTISGVAMETMPRDDAWRFLTLGRQLERAEMTCRLLNVRYGQLEHQHDASFHQWVAVLKSVSALEAFRKRYRASTDPNDVVEFLLLATEFPRSVRFSLETAEAQLRHLAGDGPNRSARLLGRTRAGLQYRDVSELIDEGLTPFLDELQDQVAAVADTVANQFFRQSPAGQLHAVTMA